MTSYVIVSLSCNWGFLRDGVFGFSAVRAVLILMTVTAALIVYFAGYQAYSSWRKIGENQGVEPLAVARTESRDLFMSLAGVLLSGLFGTGILFSAFPTIFVRTCA